jgi:protein-tyrosine phosphatase
LIVLPADERLPASASVEDFQNSDMIIALDELEHRPLMQERFPQWLDTIEYWLVHDVDKTSAQEALAQIEQKVIQLIEELAKR